MSEQKLVGDWVALPESTLNSKQWKAFTASTCRVYTTMLLKYWRKGENANGRVQWRQDELAEASGCTRQTVITCLTELKDKKWISVWEPGGRWIEGTTYEMSPEWANGHKVPEGHSYRRESVALVE